MNRSVVMAQSGIAMRIAFTRSIYHADVYLRFMAFSTESEPDCTGRCIWRQMFGYEAMVSIIRSVMSLGCDVVKRMRISGAALAVISNSEAKSTIVPSGCSCL